MITAPVAIGAAFLFMFVLGICLLPTQTNPGKAEHKKSRDPETEQLLKVIAAYEKAQRKRG